MRSLTVSARSNMMTSDTLVAVASPVVDVSPSANMDVPESTERGMSKIGVNVNSAPFTDWYDCTPEPPTTNDDTYRSPATVDPTLNF